MASVTVYTTSYCPFCTQAKALLARKGVTFTEVDVTSDPAERDRLVERSGGRRTVPQIFVGDRAIGGFDDLAALERSGELDALLVAS